jgi:dienelactone hydrolase
MRALPLPLAALLCSSALAQTAPIPLEHFTRDDEWGEVKISPDGDFYAATTGKRGREHVVFIDRKAERIVSSAGAFNGEISNFDWISPTRVLYSILEYWPDRVGPIGTGELYAIDRDGKRHQRLFGVRSGELSIGTYMKRRKAELSSGSLLTTLRDDPEHILIVERPWQVGLMQARGTPDARPVVSRLDVYTGLRRQVTTVPLANARILVDRNEQVRFAFGYDEASRLSAIWRPQAADAWQEFALDGLREESIRPLRFSADNAAVYFTAVRSGESHVRLFRMELASRAVTDVFGFEGADVTGVITDFAEAQIVGVEGYAQKTLRHWLIPEDPATRLYKALERTFAPQSVKVTSTTRDGRLAIVFVSSDRNPGDYYLFDTTTRQAALLQMTRKWIEPKRMRPVEPIQLQSRDGLTLHGYVTRPAGEAPFPMVVLPHGGPYGVRDSWRFDPEVQLLASRGYAVLQVNYRGSRGYGMDFESAGDREWGGKIQGDITDATRWAVAQGIAAADRICIYGKGYGGYAALMGVTRERGLYRCAIGFGGVYDLTRIHKESDARIERDRLAQVVGTDTAQLLAVSPVHNANSIDAPVLLIHGKHDWNADYEHSERMHAALERKQKNVELLTLAREGAVAYDQDTRREVYERILQFLDANLSSRPATSPGTP